MSRPVLLLVIALVNACFSCLIAGPAGPVEQPFTSVTNPPPVQMLVPGFTVRELPLNLNNINNLVYAPDGRLFALGYDGNVFQLKDTDSDGLEDTASYFFKNEHNEIPASIGMAWGPGGLYIASRGRVIRLRDKGDGTSELETVTGGWVPPTAPAGSGLDAVGIAVDGSGNVYFGLGCDAWLEAYRVNKTPGNSDYNIHSERGTILKISPDWKKREIISTGLRFTVSLAFNAQGDLFCTDQEGATWLPNGNPFDELLQIQPGRHYGFPPRHPKYLPGVLDEPSVFDYAPQHESTCGLHFNNPFHNGNAFGPKWWRGDAMVAGESRGKIWRTKLVKTAVGYVAQNNLIACLNMLTIDAVPTPQGDLLVTCHSGKPDWGTGPQGKGKLFKISHADNNAPQPVLAYAASPTETRVIFDRPLDPAGLKNLTRQSSLTMGQHVTAGSRFESFTPGYQVVEDQKKVPRFELPILSAGITADNRSLVLQTAPRVEAVNYAVKVPEGDDLLRRCQTNRHELPQHAAIDVLTDLTGVTADWRAATGKAAWSGWLPHLDSGVARVLTAASHEHDRLFQQLEKPGKLTLRTQLDLWLMLHPLTQPGARLDYEYPPETVTLVLKSSARFKLKTGMEVKQVSNHEWHLTVKPKRDVWLPLEITLPTGAGEPGLEVSWFTAEDSRPRPLPLRRILLPWALPKSAETPLNLARHIPEIAGGDWQRGKKVFTSEQAACSRCHQMGSEGGKIGPDLSNLIQRDYVSVLKDITEPSAAINPEHLAYTVELKDGEAVTGVVLDNAPEQVVLGQITGNNITLMKNKIVSMKASSVSLMPEGLLKNLSPAQQRDLLTFLLTEPPKKAGK